MSRIIGIAVAVVVFLALVAFALLKAGWLVIAKIAETGKHHVEWNGPGLRRPVALKEETVVVEEVVTA